MTSHGDAMRPVESELIQKLRKEISFCRARMQEAHLDKHAGLVSAYKRTIDVREDLLVLRLGDVRKG